MYILLSLLSLSLYAQSKIEIGVNNNFYSYLPLTPHLGGFLLFNHAINQQTYYIYDLQAFIYTDYEYSGASNDTAPYEIASASLDFVINCYRFFNKRDPNTIIGVGPAYRLYYQNYRTECGIIGGGAVECTSLKPFCQQFGITLMAKYDFQFTRRLGLGLNAQYNVYYRNEKKLQEKFNYSLFRTPNLFSLGLGLTYKLGEKKEGGID